MSKDRPKILIAAGGTGGHVFPAIAIAEEIKKLNANTEILFVGTKGKMESRIIPEKGYAFVTIWISGFHRGLNIKNLIFPLKLFVSIIQSIKLIKKSEPDVVIGTGGFVCGPVLFAAVILKIPTVVHESNSYPGVTTRLISSKVTKIFTSFDATSKWLKSKNKIECLGTPTRTSLEGVSKAEGARFFNLNPDKKTVFFFGGSQGASSINNAVKHIIHKLIEKEIQVIWQVGNIDDSYINEFTSIKNLWIGNFINKIEYAYALADVVVCRAGATTIAELTRLGKPAILIPYPYSAANHQTYNARTMAEAGSAVMIDDSEIKLKLEHELFNLLNNEEKRKQISDACKKLGKPEAGQKIANKIFELVR